MVVIIIQPSASASLHHLVEQRYEIPSLTSEDQNLFIQKASKKKDRLNQFLAQYPIISILTYSSFYLSVLIHLAKQDSLPKTLTETTKLLNVYTVCRQLKNHGL